MVSPATCLIGGIQYLIHPQTLGSITATIKPDALIPVTLLTTDDIFGGRLEQILDHYDAIDDVFIPEFGSVLIEKSSENGTLFNVETEVDSRKVYALDNDLAATTDPLDELPSGPYILQGPNLHQAWRLYDDENEAFNFGVIPQDVTRVERFDPLGTLSTQGFFKSIPVPSRLYSPDPSPARPLSGVRFSIPDVVSLKGVQTTMSSRAWTSLYPPLIGKTARIARDILDLGGVIVGKTKVSQFCSGQQWIDVSAPWNPLADGYQDPSGSSAGAATAAAAYDWLQTALGEDSIGGLRSPAAVVGVPSLRPTFKESMHDGVHISSPKYDTVSLTARTLSGLHHAVTAILGPPARTTHLRNIIYLGDSDAEVPPDQLQLHWEFVEVLEASLGSKARKTSLEEMWDHQPPEASRGGQSLRDFLEHAPFRSFCYDYSRKYADFGLDYQEKFDREPFVEATPAYRWELGANITDDQHESNLARLEVFRNWFDKVVLASASDTVIVFPYGVAEPKYRQDAAEIPREIHSLIPEMLAPVLGAPHLVVPFALTPFHSKVSGRTEYIPVSASVLGHPGSDTALVELAKEALDLVQWSSTSGTGRLAFPLTESRGSFEPQVPYSAVDSKLQEL